MNQRRKDALAATAARGGTEHEQKVAQEKLNGEPKGELEIRLEEQDDVWTAQGVLARTRNGNRAYLRGAALRHFLSHVKDGEAFTVRYIPMGDDFGSGDFYVLLSWLIKNGLCVKNGSRYTVDAKDLVRNAWNQAVDQMKL